MYLSKLPANRNLMEQAAFVWKKNIWLAILTISLFSVLSVAGQSVNPCVSKAIAYGDTKNGTLTTGSCVVNDKYADNYVFSGIAGDQIIIAIKRGTLSDPYVQLLNSEGSVIAFDDDSGGNRNSLLYYTLPFSGNYVIRMTTYNSGDTGTYSISLTTGAPPPPTPSGSPAPSPAPCAANPISYGETVQGEITFSCYINDAPTELYTFSGNAGDQILIQLNSSPSFYSRLMLVDAIGNSVASSSGETLDSQIPSQGYFTLLATGTYTIRAIYVQNASGAEYYPFSLSLSKLSPCPVTPISYGQSVTGILTTDSCVINEKYTDLYSFSGVARQQIEIRMTTLGGNVQRPQINVRPFNDAVSLLRQVKDSAQATPLNDPYLELVDGQGNVIASDDNGGGYPNARIPSAGFYTLPSTGTFTIRATTAYPGDTGEYTLSLNLQACSESINPTSANVSASGGTYSFNVTTNRSGCGYTAVSNQSWVTVNTTSGSDNGSISYTVAQNTTTVARTATITVSSSSSQDSDTFTITQEAACSFSINPTSADYLAAGGAGSFAITVLTGSGCSWTAVSNSNFITTSSSGTGNGTINYTVAENTTLNARSGTITVGGQTFTIRQAAVICTYSINPTSAFVPANGGNFSFALTTNNAGCAWTAVSNNSFITTTSAGTGNGTINYSVAVNTATVQRSGTITVAGLTFTVRQEAACSYSISPTGNFVGEAGGNFSFNINVLTGSGCSWTAVSNSNFITTSSSGTGNGTVNYTVAVNQTTTRRSGTITVAGQIFTVTQEAACSFSISPTNASYKAAGGAGSFAITVLTGSGCSWTAVSNSNFITTSSSGTGNGTINYTVAENTTLNARSGTITVGGQTFTVNQQAPATCSSNAATATAANSIAYGQSYIGTLSNTSCEPNTIFNDLFNFSGAEGDRIVVTMESAFFPTLELLDSSGNVIQSVSGSTRMRNVRIPAAQPYFILPTTGIYTIRASGSFLGEAGEYVLSLYKLPTANPCTYKFSPTQTYVASTGGIYSVYVLTQNGCPPISSSDLRIDANRSVEILSNVDGLVYYRVAANSSPADRQFSISINNSNAAPFQIYQYGNRAPSNDFFAGAIQLSNAGTSSPTKDATELASPNSPADGPIFGFNTGATSEANETAHAGSAAARSIWYKWTPAPGASGLYSFTTSGSDFDTVMDIYACPTSGVCSLTNITTVGSNDNTTRYDKTSKVNFRAVVGTTYYIVIDGKNGAEGTVQLVWRQYERLYRLYLQNFNGNPSPLTPDSITAVNGNRIVPATFISQGVYEFNLPADKTVYRVNIQGPEGIVWDPNNIPLDDSFSALNKPIEGKTQINQPSDDPPSGGQNVVSNATNATPRYISGYIRNITGQELPLLSVKIGFSQGANPRDPINCATVDSPIGTTAYITYQCLTQPNTLHDIIPNLVGKSFTLPVKSFPFPIVNDEFGLPSNALIASNSATYNISGRVLDGGAGTTIHLTYTPAGTAQSISLRTTTDSNGFYEFKNLAANTYTVRATRTGYIFNQPPSVNLQSNVTNLDIGSQTICSYTPPSVISTIPATGGTGQFTITTNNPTCEFTAGTSESFIVINSGATVGSGPVFFTVDPNNTGAVRTGVIRVQGQSITIRQESNSTPTPNKKALFDFDGDGKTDVSVYRPSNGTWYLQNSSAGFSSTQFGQATDVIAPADYDGDGKTDIAVFRNNTWFLQRSTQGFTSVPFGSAGDIPAPADFNGDGKAELALFRPSGGTWYIYNLTNNAVTSVQFGSAEDKPVAADYDGDGKADQAVFRPSNGTWYILKSRDGFTSVQFGSATDKPVVGDYDGDGKADQAVFRPSNGTWYIFGSALGFTSTQFGLATDVPAPGDYDGDGKTDLGIFRPDSSTWFLMRSTQGFGSVQFGASGDKPIPSAFVP